MGAAKLGGIVGKPVLQLLEAAVAVGRVAARHAVGQHGVVEGQQLVDAEAVLLGLVDVLVHRVLVKLHCLRYLAVGHGAVPEQTENLL